MINSFDAGDWESVGDIEARREFWRSAARAHRAGRHEVVVALASDDIERLKALAAKEGVTSETFAAQILHRYLVSLPN